MNRTLIGGDSYIHDHLAVSLPYLLIAACACTIGTLGNILVLCSIWKYKPLRKANNVFLGNLALADLLVASVADPFGIVGELTLWMGTHCGWVSSVDGLALWVG